MQKMSGRHQVGPDGGTDRNMAQIYEHLRSKDKDTLIDELAVLNEAAATGDVDLELLDAYLDVLSEKEPVEFERTPEEALADFHEKHALLLEQDVVPLRRKHKRSNRLALRIAASFAIIVVGCSFITEALGFDLFGRVARWTSEIFSLESTSTPYATIQVYPVAEGESREYETLQDAVDACGITAPLAPNWVPDRFENPDVSVAHISSGICIYADYNFGDEFLSIRFNESDRAEQRTVEKDSNAMTSYIVSGITHYIAMDQSIVKVVWSNGVFECHISGNLSEQEAKQIIDSIYEDDQ